jgi:hypothetical protein
MNNPISDSEYTQAPMCARCQEAARVLAEMLAHMKRCQEAVRQAYLLLSQERIRSRWERRDMQAWNTEGWDGDDDTEGARNG